MSWIKRVFDRKKLALIGPIVAPCQKLVTYMIFEQRDRSIIGEGEEYIKFSICYCVEYYMR